MSFAPVAIVGPTASGKSHLALALAARFPIEIISIDSAQVYVGMDIGTAKPSHTERARVPHHLIDIVAPDEPYSAARFRQDAQRVIREVQARGRLPLLVGGTMLYLKALREGLSDLPGADSALRQVIGHEATERGWPALHAELARLDPSTAARLDPNDAQRIQRALEVIRMTGQPMSALLRHGARTTVSHRDEASSAQCDVRVIALMANDRPALHRRIEARFDAMIAAGLVGELEQLRSRFALHAQLPSMRCVGYRQAWRMLEGEIDHATLRSTGIAATRQLAKRQMTWIRSLRDSTILDCFAPDLDVSVVRIIESATRTVHAIGDDRSAP